MFQRVKSWLWRHPDVAGRLLVALALLLFAGIGWLLSYAVGPA